MGIHADFAAFVEENGELVDSVTFPLGEKVTYRYRGYLIMLDLGKPPEQEQSRVVGVLKDGKFVYVSEFFMIDKKRRKAFIATFRELEVILW